MLKSYRIHLWLCTILPTFYAWIQIYTQLFTVLRSFDDFIRNYSPPSPNLHLKKNNRLMKIIFILFLLYTISFCLYTSHQYHTPHPLNKKYRNFVNCTASHRRNTDKSASIMHCLWRGQANQLLGLDPSLSQALAFHPPAPYLAITRTEARTT